MSNPNMSKFLKKIFNHSFLIGMASVFCPAVIQIDAVDSDPSSDWKNISEDWNNVGKQIMQSYESTRNKTAKF